MARRDAVNHPQLPPQAQKRALYNRPDCREADIVPCDFRGLGLIRLVCLKRWLGAEP